IFAEKQRCIDRSAEKLDQEIQGLHPQIRGALTRQHQIRRKKPEDKVKQREDDDQRNEVEEIRDQANPESGVTKLRLNWFVQVRLVRRESRGRGRKRWRD